MTIGSDLKYVKRVLIEESKKGKSNGLEDDPREVASQKRNYEKLKESLTT